MPEQHDIDADLAAADAAQQKTDAAIVAYETALAEAKAKLAEAYPVVSTLRSGADSRAGPRRPSLGFLGELGALA